MLRLGAPGALPNLGAAIVRPRVLSCRGRQQTRGFVDALRVHVFGGRGGDGCASFHRDRGVPMGPPDGGSGGVGGHVYLVGTAEESCLRHLSPVYRGAPGSAGQGQHKHGTVPRPVYVPVPLGTSWTAVDILRPGEPVLAARGGAGGRGNTFFASKDIPGPRFCERGYPGDAFVLEMDFKTISDVGLVGLPNAGKSSFICAVTNAKSKVAAYPFTTLTPYIAAIDYPDSAQVKIVDIPGLIRGAHRGVGLGRTFLKHLERASILAFVVDVSGARPWDDLALLRDELRSYDRDMVSRPSLVIANKADVVPIAKANFEELFRVAGCEVIPVSSKYGRNLDEAAWRLRRMVEAHHRRPMAV
ncbi:P-loop containing nucleoside triphosphate hydrolase protein [Hyaloraphidium curvatum]|nr:P-loop containing nucleoside triphosphate hydrolase protein [Hyaloraphidium curvatum]